MADEPIAIIGGTGDLGLGLALRWAKAGHEVFVGSRMVMRAEEAAKKIRERVGKDARVHGMANEEVIGRAWMVIIAVPFGAQISTLTAVREKFRAGQTVVDCTVPLEATIGGASARILGIWSGSAAEQAKRYLPETVHVLAAFQNVSAAALQDLGNPVRCDVFVCGDDAEVRTRLRPWVEAIPECRYVDGGRLENARIVESLTALLVGVNRRYKVHGAGIRLTGIGLEK